MIIMTLGRTARGTVLLCAFACGCSAEDDPGQGGSGGAAAAVVKPPMALPFAVDDYFDPSGYMRDAREGNAVMTPLDRAKEATCAGERAPVAAPRGACHIVTFSTFGTEPELTWGGVYWQFPSNNWGEKPGLALPAGATKVAFQARGVQGGEVVGFFVGGVGVTEGKPHADGFKVENQEVTLTASWQAYELVLPVGTDYSAGVVGGFGWGVGATGNVLPLKFYLDDIVWQ
jgi:hypothetical protein